MAIKSQANLLELANPGFFVNFRNIPKTSIKAESAIPNIVLFVSQFFQFRNHLVMTHCFIFEISHKMLFLFFCRTKLI